MTDHSTARARVERYIAEYEDAPNWGGPTMYPKAPAIADLKALLALTPPEGDTVSEGVVEAINDAVGDAFTEWFDDPGRSNGDELDLRPVIRAALRSRVSPQAGMREALEPFVERLEMLEDNCRKLGCGVPAETNVRTSWLRKLRAASPKRRHHESSAPCCDRREG